MKEIIDGIVHSTGDEYSPDISNPIKSYKKFRSLNDEKKRVINHKCSCGRYITIVIEENETVPGAEVGKMINEWEDKTKTEAGLMKGKSEVIWDVHQQMRNIDQRWACEDLVSTLIASLKECKLNKTTITRLDIELRDLIKEIPRKRE